VWSFPIGIFGARLAGEHSLSWRMARFASSFHIVSAKKRQMFMTVGRVGCEEDAGPMSRLLLEVGTGW
jgi:hypothetical protein